MAVNEEYLYAVLKEKYQAERMGAVHNYPDLPIPRFYFSGDELQEGSVYIADSFELPENPVHHCLFICSGQRPAAVWECWNSEVLCLENEIFSLPQLYNLIQEIYQTVKNWCSDMEYLLSHDPDIRKMLEISMSLLDNRLVVTDYNFHVLAHCEAEYTDAGRSVRLVDSFDSIPYSISSLFMQRHSASVLRRDAFFIETNEENDAPNQLNYCRHMFIEDTYMGTCALTEDGKQITDSSMLLFEQFANYVARAIFQQSLNPDSNFISMRSIFSQLLDDLPISSSSLERALRQQKATDRSETSDWHCIVIRSVHPQQPLPDEYLCETIEAMIPGASAVPFSGSIAVFCPDSSVTHGNKKGERCFEEAEQKLQNILLPFLEDMYFEAGISFPFSDIYHAKNNYRQAVAALSWCRENNTRISLFSSCAVQYMLQHCSGDFGIEYLMPPGLIELRTLSRNVDYWDTLLRYLNNECNSSRTAEELFLHRSTLAPRIEKIKKYVDIDTPIQRLYIRLCMQVYEDQNTEKRQ